MNSQFDWPLMHDAILEEDKNELVRFLKTPNIRLTNGDKVKEFESAWSDWLGVENSLFVNSGASANDLTMMALYELYGPGEVIVPPLTWVSDISSVIKAGFTPIFVDIDPKTLALDTSKTIEAINSRTRAVFLTHVLGLNGLTTVLLDFLKNNQVPLIEDVCESHGGTFLDQKLGTFGLASNFSFYFAHHITTIEGGMISTDDQKFYDVIKMMRSHGLVRESNLEKTKNYYQENYPDLNQDFVFAYASHNMRSTELNAVLGLSQLRRLDKYVEIRSTNYKTFLKNLDPKVFYTDFIVTGNSNYALTLVLIEKSIENRLKIEKILQNEKVEYRRGMAGGGNQLRQPYIKKQATFPNPEDFQVVDHIHFYSWYIGNYPTLTEDKIISLCNSLNKAVSN
jgi:CDP-6-deoxy-D-xylo-4-hexulose-3-dehydrase